MKGYQADIQAFADAGAVVFGISTESLGTNKKFAESLGLQFVILSDKDGVVAKEFGVLNARNKARRTTFVIDMTKGREIVHVESGIRAFLAPGSATNACSML